jgi:endonuclease-3
MPASSERVEQIFKRLSKCIPHPVSELVYKNEYTFCIAVLLSAQSTDRSVNLATGPLFAVADTPEKMLELGDNGLRQHIRAIGLYNNKARNILALSEMLISKHGSRIPQERDYLEQLPGIGRKSANVILNTLFNVDCIAVDTHVFRVSRRIGLASSNTPLGVERELSNSVRKEMRGNAGNLLVLHGRYVCISRNPRCLTCCISDLCHWCLREKHI